MKTIKEILFTAVVGFCWVSLIFGLGMTVVSFGLSIVEPSSGLLADGDTVSQQSIERQAVQMPDGQLDVTGRDV